MDACGLGEQLIASRKRSRFRLRICTTAWEQAKSMLRRCPRCHSFNVRRSSLRPGDAPAGPLFHSPYRCRDCGERFWLVTSRLVSLGYTVAIVVVSAGTAGTAWYLFERWIDSPGHEHRRLMRTTRKPLHWRVEASRPPSTSSTASTPKATGWHEIRTKRGLWLQRAANTGSQTRNTSWPFRFARDAAWCRTSGEQPSGCTWPLNAATRRRNTIWGSCSDRESAFRQIQRRPTSG